MFSFTYPETNLEACRLQLLNLEAYQKNLKTWERGEKEVTLIETKAKSQRNLTK